MLEDWLDQIGDITSDASGNDWIQAAAAGAVAIFIVWLILRIVGFFFRRIGCILTLAVGAAVALLVLDRGGLPNFLGGGQLDRWIDDARQSLGV